MYKTNEYFEGNVVSISFQTETLPATIGVMAKGDYEFSTSKKETMQVTSGSLTVILPGASESQTFKAGETFKVPADSSFQCRADVESSYLCLYE